MDARAWLFPEVKFMTANTLARRVLAAILLAALPAQALPALADTGCVAVSGRVITASDRSPMAGATVHLACSDTAEIFSSVPTTADGRFILSELPKETCRIAVAFDGGLYPVEQPLSLSAGGNSLVTLAINPGSVAAVHEPWVDGVGNVWNDPIKASLLVMGVAILLGILVDVTTNEETVASEF